MEIKIPLIKRTTNYEIFKHIPGNRRKHAPHIGRMTKIISHKSLMPYRPMIVNEKMGVVDGQHTLEAARALKVPVYYIIAIGANIDDVRTLNSYMKSWDEYDFLESHIETGKKQYEEVRDFMNKYELGVGLAIELLGNTNIGRSKKVREEFRAGEFKIINRQNAEIFASKILELHKHMNDYVKFNRNFLRTIEILYDKKSLKHEDVLGKLETFGWKIPALASRRLYIRFFEDLMNYKKNGRPLLLT